ncbi:hypothetical protein B0H19DRAFT_1353181 [Mycena capillaripes]|nr:hypothetical protein B0H19DRAFT_1353181 [Mycena capillaripes]
MCGCIGYLRVRCIFFMGTPACLGGLRELIRGASDFVVVSTIDTIPKNGEMAAGGMHSDHAERLPNFPPQGVSQHSNVFESETPNNLHGLKIGLATHFMASEELNVPYEIKSKADPKRTRRTRAEESSPLGKSRHHVGTLYSRSPWFRVLDRALCPSYPRSGSQFVIFSAGIASFLIDPPPTDIKNAPVPFSSAVTPRSWEINKCISTPISSPIQLSRGAALLRPNADVSMRRK